MREIYYIPEGFSVEDYKSEWENLTGEVHVGLSDNIKEYVENPSVGQLVYIPEFSFTVAPRTISNLDFWQVEYFNDFEVIKDTKPPVSMEVWTKNLDDPSEEQKLVDKYPLHYEVGRKCFISDHLRLDTGWYDIIIFVDGEEVDSKEATIYEKNVEEE